MKSSPVLRIRLISTAVVVVALILISKLYFLQIVQGDDFRVKAERQYLQPAESVWNRGTIYFEDKEGDSVGAAILKTGFTIGINPKALLDPESVFQKLNKLVPLDRSVFLTKATQKNLLYSVVAKKIDESAAQKIQALKIAGVLVYKDRYRFYPARTLAANALGLVGQKDKDNLLAGRYGLESYYDDVLRRDTSGLYSNFFAEIFSNIKKTIDTKAKFEGDIITTLEPTVEAFVEKELAAIEARWSSRATGGIVMDPKTGAIFAMGNIPTFDPNAVQGDPKVFANPSVEDVYEMGSIVKPLTMAAGLDSGAVTAESTYVDKGFLLLNGAKISNFDGKGRGLIDMQGVLNESLNTGAAYVALKMGNDLFSDYFRRFGLGEETGIDMPNEAPGLIENLKSPRDLEHATASFGQGIAMSPVITIRALSALANGGYLMTPHLVREIDYRVGLSKKVSYEKGEQVLKPETSAEISRMLVAVVDKALLGGKYKMPHYTIAAKTGTAQIAKEGGGGYYEDKYLHSFFGYFPAYDAKFIVFLYTIEPKGVGGDFASHTLTEPFMNIAKFLINYYKIPPDR